MSQTIAACIAVLFIAGCGSECQTSISGLRINGQPVTVTGCPDVNRGKIQGTVNDGTLRGVSIFPAGDYFEPGTFTCGAHEVSATVMDTGGDNPSAFYSTNYSAGGTGAPMEGSSCTLTLSDATTTKVSGTFSGHLGRSRIAGAYDYVDVSFSFTTR